MKHEGRIVNNRFIPFNTDKWEVDQQLLNGKKVTVEIKYSKPYDTTNIDGYYFVYLVDIVSKTEEFSDCFSQRQVHEKLMMAITGKYRYQEDRDGKGLRIIRDSYSKMNISEKITYVDKVKAFIAIELNVILNE